MNQIVAIVLPVFGLIALGYAAAWSGVLRRETGEALSDFVFIIAIPGPRLPHAGDGGVRRRLALGPVGRLSSPCSR